MHVEERSDSHLRCSICHEDRGALDECLGCGTVFHGECRLESGRCPTLGCPDAVRVSGKIGDRPTRRSHHVFRWVLRGCVVLVAAFLIGQLTARARWEEPYRVLKGIATAEEAYRSRHGAYGELSDLAAEGLISKEHALPVHDGCRYQLGLAEWKRVSRFAENGSCEEVRQLVSTPRYPDHRPDFFWLVAVPRAGVWGGRALFVSSDGYYLHFSHPEALPDPLELVVPHGESGCWTEFKHPSGPPPVFWSRRKERDPALTGMAVPLDGWYPIH